MTIIEKLSQYALWFMDADIQEGALKEAKKHIIDTLGCIISGSTDPMIESICRYAEQLNSAPTAAILAPKSIYTDMKTAAFVNSISAHLRDYDDMSSTMNGHPSVIALPAAMAAAWGAKADGNQLLRAYIAGVEVMSALGRSVSIRLDELGFNATSVLGVFGAAVSAGCLMGLSEEVLANALAIALGEASGTKGHFGTPCKDVTIGHTCAKGVFSAQMAACGIKANLDILGIAKGVLFGREKLDYSATEEAINSRTMDFIAPGIVLKPYPSCRGNHAAIDILISLMDEEGLSGEDIESIRCRVGRFAMETDRYPIPDSPMEGKFSIPYCLALLLHKGSVEIEDFVGEEIKEREQLLPLMERISVAEDASFGSENASGVELVIKTKDGRYFVQRRNHASGDPRTPLDQEALYKKFIQCKGAVMTDIEAQFLYAVWMDLECQKFEEWSNTLININKHSA